MNSDFVVAVHAMVFLHHKAETVSSEMLAENICTNPVRIRRVMARLKKAGLVKKTGDGIKVLGNGTLEKKLTVKAAAFSESAKAKIEAAGGKAEVI